MRPPVCARCKGTRRIRTYSGNVACPDCSRAPTKHVQKMIRAANSRPGRPFKSPFSGGSK